MSHQCVHYRHKRKPDDEVLPKTTGRVEDMVGLLLRSHRTWNIEVTIKEFPNEQFLVARGQLFRFKNGAAAAYERSMRIKASGTAQDQAKYTYPVRKIGKTDKVVLTIRKDNYKILTIHEGGGILKLFASLDHTVSLCSFGRRGRTCGAICTCATRVPM